MSSSPMRDPSPAERSEICAAGDRHFGFFAAPLSWVVALADGDGGTTGAELDSAGGIGIDDDVMIGGM